MKRGVDRIYGVFLSHNSQDKLAVERLARRLTDEAGLRPFLDKWHLVPGEPWQKALEEALDQSRTCAVFIGPRGISPWEHEEMRAALYRTALKHECHKGTNCVPYPNMLNTWQFCDFHKTANSSRQKHGSERFLASFLLFFRSSGQNA